ncbi:MAG: hypothetical protein AAGD25_06905 [Cyanobacteria bacterium P01_F01_bin.150]
MTLIARRDRIQEFTYDPRTRRYRWRGTGGGQFASKSAVMARLRTYIGEQRTGVQSTGQNLIDGNITLQEFQQQIGERLRNIHVSSAIIGHDGMENMGSADWGRVGAELKRQYYQGRDGDRRFGIKHLAEEVASGEVSAAQLLNRLDMYALSGKVSESQGFKAFNVGAFAIRVLGATDNHCKFCVAEAAKDVRPIDEVPALGCCPQCFTRCQCRIEIVEVAV